MTAIQTVSIGATPNDHTGDPIRSAFAKINANFALVGLANGIASLDGSGKLPTSQLPALALTEVFSVASQAAMLALDAHMGDVAVRSDLGQTFILAASDPAVLGNWVELLFSAPVTTVAGRTGDVTLAVADVSGAAPLASPALTGTPTAPTAPTDTNTTQLATAAFVVGQAAAVTPVMNGAGAIGTSLRFARADHVHPSDTSRLAAASNLSDVGNAGTARTNLGLGSAATHAATDFLLAASNLSDLASASAARSNLGLGSLAVLSAVTEALLSLTDITTGNASTSAHGLLPKLDGNTAHFLRGDGTWATTGSAPVTSVNGFTGAVVLAASDVSAVPTTRTVSASGLATGGGALSADRTISVPAAVGSDVTAGTSTTLAVTPKALADAGVVAGGGFSTGDVKLTIKTAADSGWAMMDDGTIGDGSSGASTRANADTSALFALVYNNLTDTTAPLKTSSGSATTRAAQGTAAAAYAAHCRVTLPLVLGRALASAGAGAGLTSRTLGQTTGAETQTLSLTPTLDSSWSDFTPTSAGSHDMTGVSGTAPVMQPTTFLNVMIKL